MSKPQRGNPSLELYDLMERAERAFAEFWAVAAGLGRGPFPRRAGFGFLITEIETGLMFSEIALSSHGNSETARRNAANAVRAYDTILRFENCVQLTWQETAEFRPKLEYLRRVIQDFSPIAPPPWRPSSG